MSNPQLSTTRPWALAAVCLLAVLSLSACSPGEPREVAIPRALLASDLGITSVETYDSMSGITLTAGVSVEFEDGIFSTEDMATLVELVAENTNNSSVDILEISGSVGPFDDGKRIDLAGFGEELGFAREKYPSGNPATFVAHRDEVVDYFDE